MSDIAPFGDKPPEDGFEFKGEFFPWRLSDIGKDLLIIDRVSGMPVEVFFETVQDEMDRGRAPILLGMIGTSIRAKYPQWTVERITRLVLNMSISQDVEFVDADEEEADRPRPLGTTSENGSSSPSTSDESSPTSSPTEAETSPTS